MFENLKTYEDFVNKSDSTEDIFENGLTDDSVYLDGELYEVGPKLTSKERKTAQDISQLMRSVNKDESYKAAKDKFVKTFMQVAKKVVNDEGLSPKVLAKLDKITLKNL